MENPFAVDYSLAPKFAVDLGLAPNSGGGAANPNIGTLLMALLGGGQDLMEYGADTSKGLQFKNLAGVGRQAIQNKNLMALMKMFLSQDGTEGKFSSKGLTMSIPQSLLEDVPAGGAQLGDRKNINPFLSSQPDISNADLAGLTSQDIMAAFGARQTQEKIGLEREQLAGKSVQDVFDMMYKGQLMRESEHRISKPEKEDPLDQPFPINVPGMGEVSLRQWNALPEDMKKYALFVHGSVKSLGDKDPLSKEEFEDLKPTEQEKLLRHFEKDPKLFSLAKEYKKAGATTISLGAKVEEKKKMSELEGQLYFNDPKWTGDLSKHLSSEDVQGVLFRSDAPKQARAEETVKFIEGKITAGGGVVQSVKFAEDGKTMIWTVKWPTGDVKEIRYAIRP